MRHATNARSLLLGLIFLSTGTVLLASDVWIQQSTQERAVWDVQLARNAQAASNITIQNQCQQAHTFTVTAQQTPFLQFLAEPTVNVPGNSSYNLPVRFNTSGMNAGQYQGTVIVKCETCKKEKTCKQDREVLPVRLTVLQDNTQQKAGPQPGIPPPPQAMPIATPTPTPTPRPAPTATTPLPTHGPSPSPSPCCPVSPATYTITYLGTLPPPDPANASIAVGINDSEDTVGGSWGKFAGYASHAFSIYPAEAPLVAKDDLLWPLDSPSPFGTGGVSSFAYGVNASGHAVGKWSIPGFMYPFWFDGVKMHNLETPKYPEGSGQAFAVNIDDDVIGVAASGKPSIASVYPDGWAAMWPHDSDPIKDHAMVNLNTLLPPGSGWKLTAAYGINDAKHVVGKGVLKGATHAFLWLGSGAPIDLGTLGGDISVAFGLNSSDEVVGYSSVKKTGAFHGFVWKKGVMKDIGALPPSYPNSVAQAINEKGCVVGDAFTAALYKPIFEGGSLGPTSHPILYSDGVLIDVNTLIPTDSGWELRTANDINDECQIVGAGYYKGSKYLTAYLLSPPGVALTGGPKPVVSIPTTATPEVEYFTKLKVGAPLTFFVPFPSSIPCCVYVAKAGAPTIEGPVTHKAYFYLLDEKDKPGANPYGTSISFSFDPTYITMVTGFKIPPGPRYGYFLFSTKKVTTPVTTSIKVKVIADKAKPGTGGEAETTITFTITPVP